MSSAKPSSVNCARWNPGDAPLTFRVALTASEAERVDPGNGVSMHTVTA